MRVQPLLGQSQIQSTHRIGATDRYVPLDVFIPLPTRYPTTVSVAREEAFWDWVHCSAAQLAGDPLPSAPSGLGPRAPRYSLPRVTHWGRGLRTAPAQALKSVRSLARSRSPQEALAQVRTARLQLSGALERSRAPAPRRSLFGFGRPSVPPGAGELRARLHFDQQLLGMLEWGLDTHFPPPTKLQSELGLLFLDRTRLRLMGLEVGEHFDSLTLASGQEALYELRSTLRRSLTVEDAIEREFESTLEQTAQLTATRAETLGTQDSVNRNSATTVGLDVGAADPTGAVPVEASSSVSQNTSVATASNVSAQVSTTTAQTTTSKVAARIRGNHRSVIKREAEETLDSLSRNTLRNANPGHGVTLHYFKILQQLQCQQERTGVRACWAPLVVDPGANLRLRATRAYQRVIDAAIQSVELPKTPTPPRKEFVPTWVSSGTHEVLLGGGPGALLTFPSSGLFYFLATVPPGQVFTGNVRAVLGGDGAQYVEVKQTQVVSGPNANGDLEVEVAAERGFVVGGPVLEVTIEVEVMSEVPGYEEAMAEYHRILRDTQLEISRLHTLARREAEPQARAALQAVLVSTDVRDEVLGAVFAQLLHGALGVPMEELEFWHRVVDFEHLGFTVYPGWHRLQRLPLPELGPRHFANVPLARVFLPLRPGYEREALQALLSRDGLDSGELRERDRFIRDLDDEVRAFNAGLLDAEGALVPQPLGPPRTESLPTAGAHVEMEVSVSSALDPQAAAQLQQTLDRLQEQVLAAREENRLRAATPKVDSTDLQLGPAPAI